MLTKLTKTILEHDQELKRTWEALTPMGRVRELLVPIAAVKLTALTDG